MRELLVSLLIQAKGNAADGLAKVGAGLDRLGGSLRRTGGTAQEAGKKTESFFSAMVKANIVSQTLMVGANRIGRAIGALPRQLIQTATTFQALRDQLELITGSSEAAAKAFAWISEFERQTPATLEQVTDAYVRLASYGLDPTTGLLRSLGDAASGSRKSLTDAVEAIADATTGQFERLREFGIRTERAKDQITFTFGSLKRTVKNDAGEITRTLTEMWDTRFGGSMQREAARLPGQVSKLIGVWQRFLSSVGQSGVLEALEGWLGGINRQLATMIQSGQLERLGQILGESIGRAITQLVGILPQLSTLLDGVGRNLDRISAALGAVNSSIEGDIAWFRRWGEIIGAVTGAISSFVGWLDNAAAALNRIGAAIQSGLAAAGRGMALGAVPYGAAALGKGRLDINLGGPGAAGATVSKLVAPKALDVSLSNAATMGGF